jgi:hypothetical protein
VGIEVNSYRCLIFFVCEFRKKEEKLFLCLCDRVVDSEQLKQSIRTELDMSKLEDYILYEDGNATYTFRVFEQFGGGGPPTNRTLEIHTTHPYSSELGYIYNSTGIFTPQGKDW